MNSFDSNYLARDTLIGGIAGVTINNKGKGIKCA
jgi:hypothetical protein